jgi:hypothetical protein
MRKIFEYYDTMTVGELSNFPHIETEVMKFISAQDNSIWPLISTSSTLDRIVASAKD